MKINRYERLYPKEWIPPTKEELEVWRKTEHYKHFIQQSQIEQYERWLSVMSDAELV